MLSLFIYLLNLLITSQAQVTQEDVQRAHQQYADALRHDGVTRVHPLDASNITKVLKKNDLVYVLFWVDSNQGTEQLNPKDIATLEIVAQVFRNQKVKFCTCEIMSNQKFAMASDVRYTGMIKIFNSGRPTTYAGQRSPDVIIPYMKKMMSINGNVISSKAEKKHYEAIELSKVVAYMEKGSKEFDEYTKASLNFNPMIQFFVVHDPKIAKSLYLKKVNTVLFVKPFEKSLTLPAKTAISEENLVEFITKHKKQRLTKMMLENIHDIWAIDLVGYAVPVFAIKNTESGKTMLSLVKSLSKHFERNTNLTFVWIDPEMFPTMLDYWRVSFEIDPLLPIFGVVEIHQQMSVWHRLPEDEQFRLPDMKKWLIGVLKGDISLQPMKPFTPPPPPTSDDEEVEDTKDEL